eukprot:5473238-Pleurochrysis_carterae.AAC.1
MALKAKTGAAAVAAAAAAMAVAAIVMAVAAVVVALEVVVATSDAGAKAGQHGGLLASRNRPLLLKR